MTASISLLNAGYVLVCLLGGMTVFGMLYHVYTRIRHDGVESDAAPSSSSSTAARDLESPSPGHPDTFVADGITYTSFPELSGGDTSASEAPGSASPTSEGYSTAQE